MKEVKKTAFTLAEVLITLGVLGVVAAITLPIFVTNMTERRNSERHANIAQKITQAMEHMRATGKLVTYASTEEFVDELKNHIKIAKICDKDHLTECWPTETVTNRAGEEYNITDAKTGKKLGLSTETNNVGLILADGAPIILNYNPQTSGMDVGDRVVASNINLPVGKGKMKNFAYTSTVTGAIDFITDVNGKAKPNREPESDSKQFDLRSLKTATFTTATPACVGEYKESMGCVKLLGYEYTAVNCQKTNVNYAGDSICGPTPSENSSDYWAGAKAACNAISGMHLPTVAELYSLYAVRSDYSSLPSSGWFWSSEEYPDGPQYNGRSVDFYLGHPHSHGKDGQEQVLCLGN